MTMSHRERVLKALSHEEPDRVPRDLGQGIATGINETAYDNLIEYLGIGSEADQARKRGHSQTALPSEAVLRRFDIDCRGLYMGRPDTELDDRSYRDEWGVVWARPEEGGHYIFREGPFQKGEPTVAEIDAHPWPEPRDPSRLEGFKERAMRLRRETDYAVVLSLPYGVVLTCQIMRGFTQWLEDLFLNPAAAEALMEHSLAVSSGIAEFALGEMGQYVDVVCFGDDLGFQDRPYMRPEVYREKVKPYHRRLVESIKSKTDAKVFMHSDGSVYALIPDFIDIGVEVLNPVQVSATGMDSARLKTEFGDDLSFWGAIDTQEVLPRGTPEDVRNEVKRRIGDLAPGGGYVMGSVHNMQADVPPENVIAMFDSALEYGRYES